MLKRGFCYHFHRIFILEIKTYKHMKTILLILAMFLGEQVVMAQDTVKVKQPVAEQPVKVKKEHKFLKDFGKTMAQAGASVAAAVVIGGTTTIVSRKQNEVLNK